MSALGPIQDFEAGGESSSVIDTADYGLVVAIGKERIDLWAQPWLDPSVAADLLITVAASLRTHGHAAQHGVPPPTVPPSTDGTER